MSALTHSLRRGAAWLKSSFLRREDGVITIETMLLMPVMLWALLFGFSVHDAFRTKGLHQKAAYSLGDAISRETAPIDPAYLDGAHQAFEYLSHSVGDTNLRLSQVYYDEASDEYLRDWSEVRGGVEPLNNSQLRGWHDRLPVMPDQERIVLFETWTTYDPIFNIGLLSNEIRTFVFTRPRYAPVVCFNDCN